MKKKLLIIIICAAVLLSACSPRLIGEAKAKEAGLEMLQQAYDVDLSDAVVTVAYQERPGVTYRDGQALQYGIEEPKRLYVVLVNPDEIGNTEYYAEVNAVSGIAYRADKAPLNIELTKEQKKKIEAIQYPEDLSKYSFSDEQVESMWFSADWLKLHFEPDMERLCSIPGTEMTDNTTPQHWIESYAVYRNGHIYLVQLLWPSMEVTSVYLFDQEA